MALRFFIECENEVVQLPVNPEQLIAPFQGNNTTDIIIKLGEVNILRDRKLSVFKIDSFFPLTAEGPYVLTKGEFKPPQFYVYFFQKMQQDKKIGRLIVTDTGINVPVVVENFEYSHNAGDDDYLYTLTLKEHRYFGVKIAELDVPVGDVEVSSATVSVPKREAASGKFAIGDMVIANGKYWYDSYGASPFGTFNNYVGKISHIVTDSSRKYQYHITTPQGGYRGWVTLSQLARK